MFCNFNFISNPVVCPLPNRAAVLAARLIFLNQLFVFHDGHVMSSLTQGIRVIWS